jgi:hypothetical protein
MESMSIYGSWVFRLESTSSLRATHASTPMAEGLGMMAEAEGSSARAAFQGVVDLVDQRIDGSATP